MFLLKEPVSAIYKVSEDNKARYVLGKFGTQTLLVMGVNPSTATDIVYDQTIRRVIGYTSRRGFDGWVMLNLYPQRTTNPQGLHVESEFNENYHRVNLASIVEALDKSKAKNIWAAWGNLIGSRRYLIGCLRDIYFEVQSRRLKWFSAGLTKEGHPKHPSRIGYRNEFSEFRIGAYIWYSHRDREYEVANDGSGVQINGEGCLDSVWQNGPGKAIRTVLQQLGCGDETRFEMMSVGLREGSTEVAPPSLSGYGQDSYKPCKDCWVISVLKEPGRWIDGPRTPFFWIEKKTGRIVRRGFEMNG